MKIFDNIGCEFSYNFTDNSFTLLGPLPGYSSLSIDQAGFSIPYLARNIYNKQIEYEIGVGYLDRVNDKLILKDKKISASSNNNESVDFTKSGNKQFFLFVHSVNFDNAFNNLFIKDRDFDIDPIKSIYIVDVSTGYVIANLPDPASCEALELEFKTIGNNGSLNIRYKDLFTLTINENAYTKLVSTGKVWIKLQSDNNDNLKIQSLENSSFNILSNPSGQDRSLQFNNNGNFDASSIYQGNNNKILAGSSSESLAKHIIPSSGSYDFIINQTKNGSSFIVYGTGNAPGYPSKNLYFTHDGKLGINMPSGVNTGSLIKPSTILHVFNTLCREGIRLENRANCYPADITLYDNPYSTRPDGTGIARIVFAGKDSSSNKVNYAQIEAKAKSSASKLGQLDFVVSNGSSSFISLSSDAQKTTINSNSSFLEVSDNISISGANVRASGTNISLSAIANINLSGTTIVENGLRLPYVSGTNVLLSINDNKQVIATTGFKIPGLSTTQESLLTTKSDGTVVAEVPKDSFWPYEIGQKIGGKDVIWNRFPYRSAQVCLNKPTKELDLESSPLEEFSIGDQLAILNLSDYSIAYRYIVDMVVSNNLISGLTLDQTVLFTNSNTNLKVYSVSKGGVLTNTIYSSGIVSDSTEIVLSSRPGINTTFNTKQKNIDFTVFGSEPVPALNIIANAGLVKVLAGNYSKYATQTKNSDKKDVPPSPAKIDGVGAGSLNSSFNNTVNFADAAGSGWISKVSVVGNNGKPSYYGTFDQNGNAYEWIEDDNKQASYSSHQYICGGSWRTTDSNSLRGYIATPKYSGLDDVGFRICSKVGYSNNLETSLNLAFVRVDNINNPPDSGYLYTESWTNRFDDTNDQPTPITKNQLGVVGYPYRISKYEITNSQYATFLNSVATGVSSIEGLYKSQMTNSVIGGISRSGTGPYSYHVKSNMSNIPVVFVDYVSAIRYINWLSNGAPSGSAVNSATTEVGAYLIEAGPGNVDQISKNRDQNYWLPTLNEWHKAAYYSPATQENSSTYTAVTVRKDSPFEYSSIAPFSSGTGLLASLSVGGYLYADYLKLNEFTVTDIDNKSYSSVFNNKESILAVSGSTYLINQRSTDQENIIGRAAFTPDKTILTQPLLITTGDLSATGNSSGFLITHSGINYVDTSGNIVEGGLFPGPDGGFLFKDPNGSGIISSSSDFKVVNIEGTSQFRPQLTNSSSYSVICNDSNGLLTGSPWFRVVPFGNLSGLSQGLVNIDEAVAITGDKLLYSPNIFIGPQLNSFSGSLLTHNGQKPAYWQANEFLKAPGAIWNRFPRRAVEFVYRANSQENVQFLDFINLDVSKGGTGPISSDTVLQEFSVEDTIAIYNQNRQVRYVKIANIGLVDSRDRNVDSSFFLAGGGGGLRVQICPPLPPDFVNTSSLTLGENDPDNGRFVGYAFAVQRGAYLDMTIEPNATSSFVCIPGDPDTGEYRFKPSTANTLSIRPGIYTAFNKTAENIDFIVYGHRKTLFNRYEPDWFNKNIHGVPTGLVPALRVHTKVDNSFAGSIESGVYVNTVGEINSTASGILPDLNAKITINTNEPYRISALNGIKKGVVLPASSSSANLELEKKYGMVISSTGTMVSGIKDISYYADLTVSGVTYTDSLITNNMVLGPIWTGVVPIPYELSLTQKILAPNYPLTINQLGQIVSIIPPPSPEVPSKPLNLNVTPKNSAVILTWDVPDNNGGSEVLGYIVEYSVTNGTSWNIYDQINAQTLLPVVSDRNTIRFLDDNIINNTSYRFRVRAYNSVGLGPYSDITAPTTPSPSICPSSPTNVRISSGEDVYKIRNSTNITLSWTPSSSIDSNITISEYIVEYWIYNNATYKDIKSATWINAANSPVNGSQTSINISGIDASSLYYFSVTAKGSNNTISHRSLYASLGSGADPRPIGTVAPPAIENPYNFGSIIFVGSCS